MLELILAVALAVIVSAACSVSEAVIYSFPWSGIERLRKEGRRSGKLLGDMRRDIDKPITAILTLNTVAHTAGAALAGAAWAELYAPDTRIWFALVFTLIILIFSEILPKTVGVVFSRQLAPVLALPLHWLIKLLFPIIVVCGGLSRIVSGGRNEPEATEEDIQAMATLTRRAGVIKPYEELSIRNILTLDTKTVESVMTPRTVVFSLPMSMTVAEAREARKVWPHSRFPVYDDDPEDIVGIVTRREMFEALADDQDDKQLSELMKPVRFVLETLTLDQLLVQFLEGRLHLFVVLDEYGGMSGVVTLEDVLEEILGSEIVDETDQVADMRELARARRRNLVASGSVTRAEGEKKAAPAAGKEKEYGEK